MQEPVFFACADLLNLEVDLLFFDTTSTYFETDEADAPVARDQRGNPGPDGTDADGAAPVARSGPRARPRTTAPDLPQVVIGLAVTREGIPVRVWVWPGNTNDQTVIARSRTTWPAGGSAG